MAAGAYANTNDLNNKWGPDNIAQWSDLNNGDSPPVYNDARTQAGFGITDAYIQSQFIDFGNYATPLQPQGFDIQTVNEWSTVLTGEWLYFNRGLRDLGGKHGDQTGNGIKNAGNIVRADIARYRGRDRLNAARSYPTSSCPGIVGNIG